MRRMHTPTGTSIMAVSPPGIHGHRAGRIDRHHRSGRPDRSVSGVAAAAPNGARSRPRRRP